MSPLRHPLVPPTKKRPWNTSCGKQAYATVDDAQTAAVFLRFKRGLRLRPYLCPTCGTYHLTSGG